ncbi:hypothetical protein LMG28138_03913 [Pararobbsia alpina]|uniref:Uncharacterized protein n=1 Tax=Pararobbsia alpina TaxID=621374 RepID=A0A6S7BCS0_9BURK|nr:hypothetical protein LMG28138_03913 [Pararobbsia alpina]
MAKSFVYARFDCTPRHDAGVYRVPDAEGDCVDAVDAICREAVLQAKIRTLEVQLKEAQEITVTSDKDGNVVAVTRTDKEGRIVRTLWER